MQDNSAHLHQGRVLVKNIISIFVLFLVQLAGHAQTPTAQRPLPVVTADLAPLVAPTNELGQPFIRNYTPKEFGAAPSNWAIVQDKRGVMYFGNAEGMLEYDGVSWRRIATPNRTVVRSLAIDQHDRIYVGEVGTFGYLAPDSLGQMRFISLLEHVPPEERTFADVLNACVTSRGVYFTASNAIFRWAENGIRLWKAQTGFQSAFVVHDTLYVIQKDIGLMRMAGDSLRLVPGGERFAVQRILFMLPFADDQILIGTAGKGLFLYDGFAFHPFRTAADSFLMQNQLYRGLTLPDGAFALSTIRGGVALIDRQGRLLQRIDKTAGLQDNTVLALHTDQQGGMWLGLFNGIAHVETPAPLSLFGEESGLKGGVVRIIRHRGVLHVATSLGVFYLDPARPHSTAFQPLAGLATQCWSFLSVGNDLLVATNDGVFNLSKNKLANLGFTGASALHLSKRDSSHIFVGLSFGLAVARFEKGTWVDAGKFSGIEEEVRSIAEEEDGTIWLGTKSQGILRLAPPTFDPAPATARVERFSVNHGLPEGEVNVYAVGERLFFASRSGLFRFDEARQRFLSDSTFGAAFADGAAGIEVLSSDKQGNVWLVATSESGDEVNCMLRQPDESFQRLRTPFLRVPKAALWAVYPEDHPAQEGSSGVVWYGGAEGLVRYDQNVPKNYTAPFSALLRRVIVNADSFLFAGAEEGESLARTAPNLSYQSKTLRFEFSATSFEAEYENLFQTYLEGFDKRWSPWTKETKKDYTNLSEGEYRFHVRAKNIYEQESRAAIYVFNILPPWWRAWWAYAGYALMVGALVFAVDRVQRRRLIKQERERAEAERKELELKKAEEIKVAYKKLKEAHEHLKATQQQLVTQEKLASLGQLTAGIAHEIKNPLNFVNNFAALSVDLAKELKEELIKRKTENLNGDEFNNIEEILDTLVQNAEKINHHGKRADGIVKSMMQHARGSSGHREPTDINQLLDDAVNLVYHGLRANNASFNVTIEKEYDETTGEISVVPQDLSRVFLNIVNNACYAANQKAKESEMESGRAGKIKTPSHPLPHSPTPSFKPTLTVSTKNLGDKIEIRIRDNGNGIPKEIRDKIFNPFFTTKPTGQGTGLGLSICYDIIVQQHKGEIKVETEEGKFTEFVVRLPRGA